MTTAEAALLGTLIYTHAGEGSRVYFLPPAIYTIVGAGHVGPQEMGTFLQVIYAHPRFHANHCVIFMPQEAKLSTECRNFYEHNKLMRPATILLGVTTKPTWRMLGAVINLGTRRFLKTPFAVTSTPGEAVAMARKALDARIA